MSGHAAAGEYLRGRPADQSEDDWTGRLDGAFSWGVLRAGVVRPGYSEEDARLMAAEYDGCQVVRVAYVYPNGEVAS